MIINQLEYELSDSGEQKSWRLQDGNGTLQNILAVGLQQLDFDIFHDLIQFVIVGKRSNTFREAKITFCDHSGDQWTISREGAKQRFVSRNGKTVSPEGVEQSILGALLDLDASMNPQESMAGICQARRLRLLDNGSIEAEDVKDSLSQSRGMSRKIQQKVLDLRQECAQIIPSLLVDNPKTLSTLMQRLRPIYYAWNEINRQKKEVKVEDDPNDVLTTDQIENFEKELSLLRDIEKASLTLLDPKESPLVLRQKLQVVEEKLRSLSREIEMGHTSLKLSARINWSKVLECLSRVEVYRGLIATSEKVLRDHDSFLSPAVKDHIKCAGDICERNNAITSELEACLSSLSLFQKRQEEKENAKTSKKFTKIVRNFVNAEPLRSEPEEDPSGIEQARLAVDHALCKMGEIKTEVDVAQNMLLASGDGLYSRHEKLVSKYGQLKRYWKDMAKKFLLPEDLKISEALKLMCSHGRMHDLLQLREGFRRSLTERREKLAEIKELIENWQYLIGSQKDTALDNEKILLSEATSLINLRPKKERQFERFKRNADRYKAMSYLTKQFAQRQMALLEKWERAFESVKGRSHPIQDGNWLRAFERFDAMRALDSLLQDQKKNPKDQEILSSQQNEYPVNIYLVSDAEKKHRLAFLNLFGQLVSDNLIVVLCDDPFREMMRKLGAGTLEDVAPQKKKTTKRKTEHEQTPAKEPEVIISPRDDVRQRADRAMEVFSSVKRFR